MKNLLLVLMFSTICVAQIDLSIHVDVRPKHQQAPPPPQPVEVKVPEGYVDLEPNDDRDDLIMINESQIGFWSVLPDGRHILQCRTMWYDRNHDNWFYGPWYIDRSISYHEYKKSRWFNVGFHDYMRKHYPKYHEKRFESHRHDDREREKDKYEDRDRHDDDRDRRLDRHDEHDRRH